MEETGLKEVSLRQADPDETIEALRLFAEAGQSVGLSDDLGRFWTEGVIDAETVLQARPWRKPGSNYKIRYSQKTLDWIKSLSPGERQLEKGAAEAERGMRQTTVRFQLDLAKLRTPKRSSS